jgi:hypothetical protein
MPTTFHKNLPVGSKVDRGDRQTHRQDDDLISLFPFFVKWTKKFITLSAHSFFSPPPTLTLSAAVVPRGFDLKKQQAKNSKSFLQQHRCY